MRHLYRGRTEKEENYISLVQEMKPIYSTLFCQTFRGQSFTTLDTEAGYSWGGDRQFSKDNWEYEATWRIVRGIDCSKGKF